MKIIHSFNNFLKEILKFYLFFNKPEKKRFNFLFFLLILNSVLDIFTIAALIPVVDSILNFENSYTIKTFISLKLISSNNHFNIKILILATYFVIVFCKTIFSIMLNYYQNKFVSNFSNRISILILRELYRKPLNFFLNMNSSFFVKIFQTEINSIINYNQALFIFLTELSIVFLIFLSIIIYKPLVSVFLLIFISGTSLLFLFMTKRLLDNWGLVRISNDQALYKILNDFFTGIRELKLSESYETAMTIIFKKFQIKSNLHKKFSTLNSAPRYYYEFSLALIIVIFLGIFLLMKFELDQIAIFSFVFIAMASKVLPSLNRITTSFQTLRFSRPSLKILNEFLIQKTPIQINKLSFKSILNLENITMNFGPNLLFKNETIKINSGEKILITGPSGSGKTTLLNIISLLQKPNKGDVILDGQKLSDSPTILKNIKYVTQTPFFFDDSIINNIHLDHKTKPNVKFILELLKLFDLEVLLKNEGLDSQIGEKAQKISGGQKQRLALIRALYEKPKMLLLDEFTSALDEINEKNIFNTLFKKFDWITIIAISHQTKYKYLFDKEIQILDGKIYTNLIN